MGKEDQKKAACNVVMVCDIRVPNVIQSQGLKMEDL